MDHSSVFDLIAASGPFDEYAGKMMLYGRFVGDWDIDAAWYEQGAVCKKLKGEWHFAWILGGRGVQDVLFVVDAPPHKFGTTLRCYDPTEDVWHISWMQPYGGEFVHMVGRQVGDRVVQETIPAEGQRRERWSFTDITPDSFLWLGEVSTDNGATWTLEQEMRTTRRTAK